MTRIGRRRLAVALAAVLVAGHVRPALAYLKFGVVVDGREVALHWPTSPVRYFISDAAAAPGAGPVDLQAAAASAFATWQAVPDASIAYEFVGFTSASPLLDDGQSTLGFAERPEFDRVLAATSFLLDEVTGELLEADVFFNSAFRWSTSPSGEAGRYDLQSIALHEIGHLSGLGHSALGETDLQASGGRRVIAAASVMFPIAYGSGSVAGRTLRADDIAGIVDLYPAVGAAGRGSISGRVTLNGSGVFGAHVVAFNLATGELVGGFSLDTDGRFSIAGLTPGPHVLRVEPMDDVDVDGFFGGGAPVDVDFQVTIHPRLVVVPSGGDSGSVEVEVRRK